MSRRNGKWARDLLTFFRNLRTAATLAAAGGGSAVGRRDRVRLSLHSLSLTVTAAAAGRGSAPTREKHLRRVVGLANASADAVVLCGDMGLEDAFGEIGEANHPPPCECDAGLKGEWKYKGLAAL